MTQNLAEEMICSQQQGKEMLGPLISKFESLKCCRRLGFMNKQMHIKKVDLCLPVRPVLCFGFPASLTGGEGRFAGRDHALLFKAECGFAQAQPCTPSFIWLASAR